MLTILYFAGLREALGAPSETLECPEGVETVGQLRDWLRRRGGAWADALGPDRAVRMAVDQVMAREDSVIAASSEVAFFPPVTGG